MNEQAFFETQMLDDEILAIILHGSLDATKTGEFDTEIGKHIEQGRFKIIIDCRNLKMVSSAGIGSLVMLQKRLRQRGGVVKLAALFGPAAEVIKIVKLDKVFDIYGDMEYARESFYE